jgi:mannose-1-phosphate guanylyltransferase / phosphomannomutase
VQYKFDILSVSHLIDIWRYQMIPGTLLNNQISLNMMQSTLVGIPSPSAIRSEKFPGVRIGSDPVLGKHCMIFGNAFIGNRFRCDDDVFVRDNTAIGDNVSLGKGSFIDSDVVIADFVTIGDNVWIPRKTRIGSRVVIGSNVRFLTEPLCHSATQRKVRGIILEDDCVIENNAFISPGVCIGAGTRVEAGSVVTRDVLSGVHALKSR